MTPERWRQIEEIYHLALEHEAGQRSAFLKQACDGDEEMLREIESLLAHEEPAEEFMKAPGMAVLAQAVAHDRTGSMIGRRIGPYQILSLLGAGGMGEVYRAIDTRLDRAVAIKVLPAHLAANAESRQRFEREARAVSSLNYPHICALYDIGKQDGFDFLVMEYLEGETLSTRLKKGPLPMDQVLRYAIEIADALDQAHRKGVFHRDLKPGNIMLTKSGTKLLDFGLAKLRGPEGFPVSAGLSAVPAEAESLTGKGTILGTLQYMAPEQLEGKETDARTDIFAFGGMVYEMATGHKAFDGKNAPSVMAAILERDPAPISTLQPLTPSGFDHVVKTCIAKDPDARWQGAADLARELRWIAESGKRPPGLTPVGHGRDKWAWIAATAIASLIAGVLAIAHFTRKTPDAAAVRFSFAPPFKSNALDLSVSPDGRRIAFADAGGRSELWLRSIESVTAEKLPGTEGAWRPFWSPDGRSLRFFSSGAVKTVEVGNRQSPVQTVTSVNLEFGSAWSPEGIILYTPEGTGTGLYRVAASGGAATPANACGAAVRHNTAAADWRATFLTRTCRDGLGIYRTGYVLGFAGRRTGVSGSGAADRRTNRLAGPCGEPTSLD